VSALVPAGKEHDICHPRLVTTGTTPHTSITGQSRYEITHHHRTTHHQPGSVAAEGVAGDLRELFGWVVREGVTNAVRHSRAHHVSVRLERRAIEVFNDVADHAAPSTPGHGLTGLTERAEALGGDVWVGPEGEAGYRLRVEVPV
jgi:signal transduction histidine kinase